MYRTLRPLIFRLPPETAHHLTIELLRVTGALPPLAACVRFFLGAGSGSNHPVEAAGLNFANPIGMAAGYDKDGLAWRGLAALGFGHIELGTVTPQAQPGNPQPRLFRLVEDRAVINRMGFNNRGADFLASRLRNRKPAGVVVGVNIGKNRATPLQDAHQDYLVLARKFLPLADYLAVNVSSPNTPGLRDLQAGAQLERILLPVMHERGLFQQTQGVCRPVFVKFAPDLTPGELEDTVQTAIACGVDGLIAANTSVQRNGLRSTCAAQAGGLSGAPIRHLSLECLRQTAQIVDGRCALIASGGIFTAQDVHQRLDAGANLVQIYTGLIYEGPALVRHLLAG